MKQLSEQHKNPALDYLSGEPEFNLFFLGDIEVYGMDKEPVHTFTDEAWTKGSFPYLILQFFDNFLLYSKDKTVPAEKIADFLREQKGTALSGKKELVEQIQPYFSDWTLQPTHLSRLDRTSLFANSQDMQSDNIKILRLEEKHIPELSQLLIQIDEFANYKMMSKEDMHERLRVNIQECGRSYGLFLDTDQGPRIVATAQTAAENSRSAMIVGVATLPEFRKSGYASTVVKQLCMDCLDDGKEFICLFYDNPEAGKIYNRIGFKELGIYSMLTNRSSNSSTGIGR